MFVGESGCWIRSMTSVIDKLEVFLVGLGPIGRYALLVVMVIVAEVVGVLPAEGLHVHVSDLFVVRISEDVLWLDPENAANVGPA